MGCNLCDPGGASRASHLRPRAESLVHRTRVGGIGVVPAGNPIACALIWAAGESCRAVLQQSCPASMAREARWYQLELALVWRSGGGGRGEGGAGGSSTAAGAGGQMLGSSATIPALPRAAPTTGEGLARAEFLNKHAA